MLAAPCRLKTHSLKMCLHCCREGYQIHSYGRQAIQERTPGTRISMPFLVVSDNNQDTVGKILDSCISFVGRSFDQGTWIRRNKDSMAANGRESPNLRSGTSVLAFRHKQCFDDPAVELKADENIETNASSLPDLVKSPVIGSPNTVSQVCSVNTTTLVYSDLCLADQPISREPPDIQSASVFD